MPLEADSGRRCARAKQKTDWSCKLSLFHQVSLRELVVFENVLAVITYRSMQMAEELQCQQMHDGTGILERSSAVSFTPSFQSPGFLPE